MAEEGKKVLIAIDGSEQAQQAFQWYLTNVHKEGDSVVLAHVGETPTQPSFAFRAGLALEREEWNAMLEDAKKKSKELKHKFGGELKEKKIPFKFKVESGQPGVHLCNIAKEEDVNMLVMGTRGQGTVRRTIMGSVSDYVIHHIHVPVLVYRG